MACQTFEQSLQELVELKLQCHFSRVHYMMYHGVRDQKNANALSMRLKECCGKQQCKTLEYCLLDCHRCHHCPYCLNIQKSHSEYFSLIF